MERILKNALNILLGMVLIAKIANWFFSFDEATNDLINTVMFCLIGTIYIIWSVYQTKINFKVLLVLCGIVIISMNFISLGYWFKIVGIVCILIPIVLFQFQGKKEKG
jgi:hypothetical protein